MSLICKFLIHSFLFLAIYLIEFSCNMDVADYILTVQFNVFLCPLYFLQVGNCYLETQLDSGSIHLVGSILFFHQEAHHI